MSNTIVYSQQETHNKNRQRSINPKHKSNNKEQTKEISNE